MRARRRLTLFVVLLVLRAWSFASAQQLPPDVAPDQYQLRFALDPERGTFAGSEQILVEVAKPTTRITLNAAGLTLKQVTIASGWTSQPAAVAVDEGRETATLTVRRRVPAGEARIRIEYEGRLGRTPRGLFAGRYNGRAYVASQFEATDARRAYPCFDQPDMKASFLVTVVAPAGDVVISNGRVLADLPGPAANEHTVRFSTTRKMSTYLLALAAGDFTCLDGRSETERVRVCALGDRKPLLRFALDAAQSFIRFYDGYFGVPYPFGKLDLVAIPDLPGAMENTGAIFFGERELLVDRDTASVAGQKLVATTIAHEMAHQWIGDLVTMKWWDDLWLKEGFATFFETRPVREWRPEWQVRLDEVASAEEAMAEDGLPSTRAARARVVTPAEIDEAYDAIAYQKAGAVLRMLESAMGPDAFRAGVSAFLKRFAYGNATAEDFWSTMAEGNVHGVDQVLRSFLEQPGVPIVSLSARCVTDATSTLALAQRRFWSDPKQAPGSPLLWAIPVATRPIAPQPGVPALFTTRLLTGVGQSFDLAGCNTIVVGNADAAGYFRTAYAPEVLARLAKDAVPQMTPSERLRLLDDQWAIAGGGGEDIGAYLSLLSGYGREPAAQILERMGDTLRAIDDVLTTDGNREAFHAWVRELLAPTTGQVEKARADGTEISRGQVQAAALYVLGTVGADAGVRTRARAAVMEQAVGDAADPDLLDVLTRVAAAGGDGAVFERVMANIEQASSPRAYERGMRVLGDFTDPALVGRALEYTLSERVRGPDVAAVIGSALHNPSARSTAWSFVKSRWKDIIAKGDAEQTVPAILAATEGFCDPALRDDVKTFFGGKGAGNSRLLKQTLDRIQGCIDFRAAQQENLQRWLAAR